MAFTKNLSKFLIRGITLIARRLRDSRRTFGMPGVRELFGSRSAGGYTFSKLVAARREAANPRVMKED